MTIQELKSKEGLVIDTNLLLLYLMGVYNPKKISEFKRTQQFLEEDFYLLLRFIGFFKRIVVTPHILTEVTNLAENKTFPTLSKIIKALEESLINSNTLIETAPTCFQKFGLSDTAIQYLAQQNYFILTDDFPLYGYLSSKGFSVANFNHLRTNSLLGN